MYDWRPGGFGLYLHWPFCQSKCPYCDFNSHVVDILDHTDWQSAYLSEIDRYGEATRGRNLQTIYFGGGTPSLMKPEVVGAIIERVRRTWTTVNDLEVTLEANPGSVEAGRFRSFRDAGVSRVSLGVQALNDADLKLLGRVHTSKEALRALDVAMSTFDRVSFDLIYSRQNQSIEDWRKELTRALELAGDHLSLYQLTVEEGTVFAKRAAMGLLRGLPDEEQSASMYELTQELCDAAGLPAYEVSNHARSGAESRHNQIYWRGGDYVGIGPGAHGRLSDNAGRYSTETALAPQKWLSDVMTGGNGERVRQTLSADDMALEYLLMSLRTNDGLNLARFNAMAGRPLNAGAIAQLADHALVAQSDGHLSVTRKGRLVLNGIIRELATY